MTNTDHAFLVRHFTWSRASTLAYCVVFGILGMVGFLVHCQIYPHLLRENFWSSIVSAAFGILISLLFLLLLSAPCFWIAGKLVMRFLSNRRDLIQIDQSGIIKGNTHVNWQTVVWFGCTRVPFSNRVDILFKCSSESVYPRLLRVDQPLTLKEYETLIQEIEKHVLPKYPHITIGVKRNWFHASRLVIDW